MGVTVEGYFERFCTKPNCAETIVFPSGGAEYLSREAVAPVYFNKSFWHTLVWST